MKLFLNVNTKIFYMQRKTRFLVGFLSMFFLFLTIIGCGDFVVKPDDKPTGEVQKAPIDKWGNDKYNPNSVGNQSALKLTDDNSISHLDGTGVDRYIRYENGMQYIIYSEAEGGMAIVNVTKDSLEIELLKKQLLR